MNRILLHLPMFLLISVMAVTACTPRVETVEVEVTRVVEVPVEVTRVVEVPPAPPPPPEPQAPRELTLLVGAGEETVAINAFLPETIRIRAGDTVTWKLDSDEVHTVTFLSGGEEPEVAIPVPGGGPTDLMFDPQVAFPTRGPGAPVETYSGTGYFNAGLMSKEPAGPDAPPNDTFTLTFDTPGTYEYVCLLHPFMRGEVVVEPATATDVPSQAELDATAEAELAPLMAQIEALKAAGERVKSEPGPGGTTIWFVPAGTVGADPRVELFEFLPEDLTIQEGDTVVWTSLSFHHVAFHPDIPEVEFVLPTPQEQGPPLLLFNPEVVFPVKPAGEFDGTGLFSSGFIGAGPLP
ncbi:MAG: hypothetical protein ACE5I2_12375, partial [Anaerolineae bacterium]